VKIKTMTGAEAVVRVLEANGVSHVFGICGHTVIGVLDALGRSKVRFVSVHHEGVASHAADGLARRTGKAGVVLVHLGPGLTNAITGIANAMHDAVPMVVISGNIQSYFFGRNAHQETNLHADANQADSLAPFTKRIWRVQQAEALVPSLDAAFRIAESGRKGPVLVDVAMDVFSLPVEMSDPWTPSPVPQPPALSRAAARDIVASLRAARRAVLYLGYGAASDAGARAARTLIEKLNIPVAYELLGKGIVPDDHELNVGVTGFWGSPAANEACKHADVLLAVGTKFAELDACSWISGAVFTIPPTSLIHIASDPDEIGRSYRPTMGFVADPVLALEAIVDELSGQASSPPRLDDHLRKIRADFAEKLLVVQRSAGVPMHPARAVAEIGNALPPNAVLVGDTGWNKNGVAQQLKTSSPRAFLAPGSYATMGFGPTAALGAALDGSGAPVVALIGDGAFLTNISVVLTAVEEKIPVVWVVMNNSGYGSIAGLQRLGFGSEYGTRFDTSLMNFVALARALGADGARVEHVGQVGDLLRAAIATRKPYLLEIPTTNDPAPITGVWDVIDLYKRAAEANAAVRA
jgi:acetolactate synthase-1/2/3 large subunit